MAKSTTNPTEPTPPVPEDGLSYVRRTLRVVSLLGLTLRQCDLALGERLRRMEDLVEAGHYDPVVTPAGVVDYRLTERGAAYLATGGRLHLESASEMKAVALLNKMRAG